MRIFYDAPHRITSERLAEICTQHIVPILPINTICCGMRHRGSKNLPVFYHARAPGHFKHKNELTKKVSFGIIR